MSKDSRPPCGQCYFFSFDGLLRACFHPEEPHYLDKGPQKCKPFVASDTKRTAGTQFAVRLTLEEFRKRMQSNTGQGKEL